MRLWYLNQRRLMRMCVSTQVLPEPSLFAHMKYGSRRKARPKIRHLAPLRPSIKKCLFAVPLPTHFFPSTQNCFWHFWKIKLFLPHFHQKNRHFPHYAALKGKKKKFSYLPTQPKGERGGSVVECRTPEREVRGSRPTAAVLCP